MGTNPTKVGAFSVIMNIGNLDVTFFSSSSACSFVQPQQEAFFCFSFLFPTRIVRLSFFKLFFYIECLEMHVTALPQSGNASD